MGLRTTSNSSQMARTSEACQAGWHEPAPTVMSDGRLGHNGLSEAATTETGLRGNDDRHVETFSPPCR